MIEKYLVVSAITFVRQFSRMAEDVETYGVISVLDRNGRVGAFISPSVLDELEDLRRRKRKLERIEDMGTSFFDALDDADIS